MLVFRILAYFLICLLAIALALSIRRAILSRKYLENKKRPVCLSFLFGFLLACSIIFPNQLYLFYASTLRSDTITSLNLQIDLSTEFLVEGIKARDFGWNLALMKIDQNLGRKNYNILNPGHLYSENYTYYQYSLIYAFSEPFDDDSLLVYGSTSMAYGFQEVNWPEIAEFSPGDVILFFVAEGHPHDSRANGQTCQRILSYVKIVEYDPLLPLNEQSENAKNQIDGYFGYLD
jgi:hypothetical protein